MSPPPSAQAITSGPLFLGLEIGVERISATLIDERLAVVEEVGIELDEVSRGTGKPELSTRRGILRPSTPSESGSDESRQPIELIIRGLEAVLDLLRPGGRLSRVVAISGSAHSSLVLLTSHYTSALTSLDASRPVHTQLFPDSTAALNFVLPTIATPLDTTSLPSLNYLASLVPPSPTVPRLRLETPAVRLLSLPWQDAEHVRSLGTLIAGLLVGEVVGEDLGTVEAEWGMWDQERGDWDGQMLGKVAGAAGVEVDDLKRKLVVEREERSSRTVSAYWAQRYGFGEGCQVTSFIPLHLATYLSLRPSPRDAVLALNTLDALLIPTTSYRPSYHHNLYRHPAQPPTEEPIWIAAVTDRNGDSARTFIRDLYANGSWSVLNQLVSVVAPGGSIGYDDKLYEFVYLMLEVYERGVTRGVARFEGGVFQEEFRDLRANPRCLIESQFMAFRTRYSTIATFLSSPPVTIQPVVPPRTALGPVYDVFSTDALPDRVLIAGSLANSPACASVLSDIFNAPVYTHTHPPSSSSFSATALGSAYLALWSHHLSLHPTSTLTFPQLLTPPFGTPPPLRRARSSTHMLRSVPSRSRLNDQEITPVHSRQTTASSGMDGSTSTGVTSVDGAGGEVGKDVGRGLRKVASPDRDAWKAYESMLGEWARLEEIAQKGWVRR